MSQYKMKTQVKTPVCKIKIRPKSKQASTYRKHGFRGYLGIDTFVNLPNPHTHRQIHAEAAVALRLAYIDG